MSEKSFVDLLNAYLAVESLLNSRYISFDTRERALHTLRNLNEQFADLLRQHDQNDEGSNSQAAD